MEIIISIIIIINYSFLFMFFLHQYFQLDHHQVFSSSPDNLAPYQLWITCCLHWVAPGFFTLYISYIGLPQVFLHFLHWIGTGFLHFTFLTLGCHRFFPLPLCQKRLLFEIMVNHKIHCLFKIVWKFQVLCLDVLAFPFLGIS